MTIIDRLREAAANRSGIQLTDDEVVALVDEIDQSIARGPAPIINVNFTQPTQDATDDTSDRRMGESRSGPLFPNGD